MSNMLTLSSRERDFLERKKAGTSYAQIGREVGISTGRARQIVLKAEQKIERSMNNDDGWETLSVRAKNGLEAGIRGTWYEGTRVPKTEVRDIILSGKWHPLKQRNLGKKTAQEILKWADIPKVCSCCGQIIQK